MVLIESKRPFLLLAVIIALAGFIVFQRYQDFTEGKTIRIYTAAGAVKLDVEYAETPEKWEQGLMGREFLRENSGMIFIFPDEKIRDFWMKDTLIPLDAIFISTSGVVKEIASLEPCPAPVGCPVYESKNPARFVVEINAGSAERLKITPGDILEISGF